MKARGKPKKISISICSETLSPGSCPASSSLQHALFDASTKPDGTEAIIAEAKDGTVPLTRVRVVFAFGNDLKRRHCVSRGGCCRAI